MITARDAEFHPVPAGEPEWAEVFSLGFSIPEEQIVVRVYLFFRPQFGVVQTSVTVVSRDALQPWQSDFADFRPHVPAPESLANFTLANGVSLQTIEPHTRWRMTLDDRDGTRFDVVFDATMPPFATFDTAVNPLAPATVPPGVGNFEQSGRVTGSLTLRGRELRVDSPTMMNRAWAPRRDRAHHGPTGSLGATWLHAHCQDGSALFAVWRFKLGQPQQASLLYGYALQSGAARALVRGEARIVHDADRYPTTIEIDVTDRDGRPYRATSRCVNRAAWACWPNMATFCVLAEWSLADGRTGHGEVLQFMETAGLIEVEAASRKDRT